MPTKDELKDNLNENNRVLEKKDALIRENLKRIEQQNVELDALQAEFDKYQTDADKMIVQNAEDIRKEMLALARMESPVYALAYVEAALAAFPSFAEDDTIDLSRVAPSPQVFFDLRDA